MRCSSPSFSSSRQPSLPTPCARPVQVVLPHHSALNAPPLVSARLVRHRPPARGGDGGDGAALFAEARAVWAKRAPRLRAPSRIIAAVEFACSPEGVSSRGQTPLPRRHL